MPTTYRQAGVTYRQAGLLYRGAGSVFPPISVTIGGADRSTNVDVTSFTIDQILTRRGDHAQLTVVDPTNTLSVARFATVTVTDDSANTLFRGWVTKSRARSINAGERHFNLTCQDATIFLTGRGANKKYTNWYVTDIARDLVLNASPSVGITCTNTPVGQGPRVTFTSSHVALATELTRLAKLASLILSTIGGGIYEWYVDYNSDLHFFVASTAPVSNVVLDDINPAGTHLSYDGDSFYYETDDTQLGNSVLVRGAQLLSLPISDQFTGDGVQTGFSLSQAPDITNGGMPAVTVGGAAQTVAQASGSTPTTQWTVGQNATTLIWSLNAGTASAPGNGVAVVCTYQYAVPAFSRATNATDIAALASLPNTGTFERIIVDTGITSQQSAIARANAELAAYGQAYKNIHAEPLPVSTGAIIGDLAAGKQVRIINSQLGIDQFMLIMKLTIRSRGPVLYQYVLETQAIN